MSEESGASINCCGCMAAILILVAFVFFCKAWLFGGVGVGEKTWGIELIPPRIYEVSESAEPVEPVVTE